MEEDLTAASNQVKQKTLKLQKQLTQNQTAVRKQLTDLSVHSDTAAKKLRAVIAKVTHVTSRLSPLTPELLLIHLFALC